MSTGGAVHRTRTSRLISKKPLMHSTAQPMSPTAVLYFMGPAFLGSVALQRMGKERQGSRTKPHFGPCKPILEQVLPWVETLGHVASSGCAPATVAANEKSPSWRC